MAATKNQEIVFLTGGGSLYWIAANALVEKFGPITIIREQPEPKSLFLKRRFRKLGLVTLLGQLGFNLLSRFIRKASDQKREQMVREAGGNWDLPAGCRIIDVESVNAAECREAIKQAGPAVVMVVGTRMIRRETLQCVDVPFINYHPGLTPKYRGLNGGYWTLWNNDAENLGNTVHLVDLDVDTGGILYQERLSMPPGNNITTYHYVMAVKACPLVVRAVGDAIDRKLKPVTNGLPSRQWYHPTLWGYLWCGLTRGIW